MKKLRSLSNHLKFLSLGIFVFLLIPKLNATHIVGAELFYECLNPSIKQYRLTLKMYRDCFNGQAPFDDPIEIFIFRGNNGSLYNVIQVPKPANTPQIPTNTLNCAVSPYTICVEEAIYQTITNLPSNPQGYDIAWARCCRNSAITNLQDPLLEGVTFLAHIPDPGLAACNSMPQFNNIPPRFICRNVPFSFDYSATDPDGDSLVYQITNPYTGTNFQGMGAENNQQVPGNNPPVVSNQPGGSYNPMGPPPYNNVIFAGGFNFLNPFGSNNLTINPQTGFLQVTPTITGIFVMAVSVFEYRNGQLLSENKRDFQIHVLNCLPQGAPPEITHNLNNIPHSNDTIIVEAQEPFCYPVTITDPQVSGVLTTYTVSSIFGTGANAPTFTYSGSNPINGQVCWTPSCQYVNQTLMFVLSADDDGDCGNSLNPFDTVWVRITLAPNNPPVITPDLSGLNASGNTITINATTQVCYPFTVTDLEGDNLTVTPSSPIFNTANPPVVSITSQNPFAGTVCWTPSCAYVGQTIPITLTAEDTSKCNVTHTVTSTVNILIQSPPNVPPSIVPDLTNTNHVGDTIYVDAGQGLCFDFTATDPDVNDVLTALGVNAIFSGLNAPTFITNGTNPLTGQICWTPSCQYVNQLVPLIFKAKDQGVCANIGEDQDTVWVRVNLPPNSPPTINANLNAYPHNGDTLFVFTEGSFCIPFTASDPNAADTLDFIPLSPIFTTGTNPPVVTLTGENPVNGTICWTPDCSYDGQLIPFIFSVADEGACNNILTDRDTFYVSISTPPNNPPVIVHNLAGNSFNGDTIFIDALDNTCYTFTVNDVNAGDTLSTVTISPIFNLPNGPSFTFSGTNPLTGQICWTPDCQYVNQVIPLIISATDDAICNTQLSANDTVYIAVTLPPNNPPTITHNLNGNVFSGDTIFANATENLCFGLNFSDINGTDTLTAFPVSANLVSGNGNFTWSGVNPLTGQVCWIPDCSLEGQTVEFIVGVQDNGRCNNVMFAYDTVYVYINDPNTIPPVVEHDLTGTPHVGDLITINQGDTVCYDFYVADMTPESGVQYFFEVQDYVSGTNLGFGYANTVYVNDTIFGTICFPSFCYNGGSTYRLVITGRDEEICPPYQEAKDTVYIKVNTNFYAIAPPDGGACQGSGGLELNVTAFGGTAPYYYTWNCTNPLGCGISDPYIPNPTVNPTDTTVYYVQLTDVNGCTSEIDSVTVWPAGIPIVDAGRDTAICQGAWGINLQGTVINPQQAPPPYTYLWSPTSGMTAGQEISPNPYVRPDTTTIYTLIVTSANGCSSEVSTVDSLSTVLVLVKNRPKAFAGADTSVCYQDSLQFLGYVFGAGPDYTYQWSPQQGLDNPFALNPMASPQFTTTYSLTVWSNGCPSDADTMRVVVHAIPTANPINSVDVCAYDSVQLNGYGAGDPTGANYTYHWSPATGLSNPDIANPFAHPLATTTYALNVTSQYGCQSAAYNTTITVLPTPIASALESQAICIGDTVELLGSHIWHNNLSGSPLVYQWTPNSWIDDAFGTNPKVYPLQNTLYILSTRVGTCVTKDSVLITVNPGPEIQLLADTTQLCSNQSTYLQVLGGFGSPNVSWSPSTGLSNPNGVSTQASPSVTTTYYVNLSEGGCAARDSITLSVNPAPSADFAHSNLLGCLPLEVSFIENANNELAYIWNFGDGSPVDNTPNPTHTYTQVGTYYAYLIVKSSGGCVDTSGISVVTVSDGPSADFTSTPLPYSTLTLPDAHLQLRDLSIVASSWLWSFGDGTYSTEENPVHTWQQAGTYTVSLFATDAAGCTDSISYTYNVTEPNLFVPNVFSPNGDGVHDFFNVVYTGHESFSLQVYDRWGVQMFASTSSQTQWDGKKSGGQECAMGTYYYTLKVGEKVWNGHLSLMR